MIIPTVASTREILTVRAPERRLDRLLRPRPRRHPRRGRGPPPRRREALAGGQVEALTLSGSSPSPSTHGLYSDLIALAKARRVPAFLDTYGPALEGIWGFWPEAIQLNRREAGLHLRKANPTDADLDRMLADWSRRGVHLAVVTDGPGAVLARIRGKPYRATPPTVEAVNPIGSGDCLLAGLVDAHLLGLDPEATLRRGIAAAVANALVWDAGAIDREEVRRLEESVTIEG